MVLTVDVERRRVSLDPRDPAFFVDPYPAYREIRARTPAFFWEQYGFWCFARHAQVSALLRDRRFGRQILHVATREELGWSEPPPHVAPFLEMERHSLLELEPPAHTRLRALVSRAFVSRQIERLAPRIAELAHAAIDRIAARRTGEIIADFAAPIPVVVIAELLGVPAAAAPKLLDWSHRMVAMYQFGRDRAVEESAVAATQEFSAFLRAHIARRRAARTDDLISRLIAAETDEGRLGEDEMITTCVLLLNAGHEATVHATGNGVKAMLEAGIDPARPSRRPRPVRRWSTNCCVSTRRSICSRAMRWRMSRSTAFGSVAATRSACFWGRRIAIPNAFPIRTPSNRLARPIRMCLSAPASTSVSGRRWRASNWRWRCRSCSGGCRGSGSPAGRASATASTSAVWRRCRRRGDGDPCAPAAAPRIRQFPSPRDCCRKPIGTKMISRAFASCL